MCNGTSFTVGKIIPSRGAGTRDARSVGQRLIYSATEALGQAQSKAVNVYSASQWTRMIKHDNFID